jgi:predicted oxidoreductase
LRRLATDHLDILLLHWPDALVEPEEVAGAFDQLHRSGKVRHFGVSNHTPTQIDLLKRYVRQPLVANQIYLSLENSYLVAGGLVTLWSQDANPYNYVGAAGTLDYCRLHGIQVQAWSPLRGELVNSTNSTSSSIKQAAQVLESIAKKKNATPSAVALAWLLRHPAGIVPVIYSNSPDHVVEDSAAMDITLSSEEWYRLLAATYGIRSRKPI